MPCTNRDIKQGKTKEKNKTERKGKQDLIEILKTYYKMLIKLAFSDDKKKLH